MSRILPLALSLLAAAGTAASHEVHHEVRSGEATIVSFTEGRGTPFAGEPYEVYRPGEESPFQTGRTDLLGRVVFTPDRRGDWRVRAFSEDGHGADLVVSAGPGNGTASGGNGSPGTAWEDRSSRIVLGLGILLGAFGLVSIMQRGRRR